jgi:SAM-dependent methyltransferase
LVSSWPLRKRVNPNHGGTIEANPRNALEFLLKTVPEFSVRVAEKDVLDVGCGLGWQCISIAQQEAAKSITGLDIRFVAEQIRNAELAGVADRVRFISEVPADETFDVVYSCSSFEHFSEPEKMLDRMIAFARPGGAIIIAWAEPWWSPYGSHFSGYTGLPWSNVWFSERTLLKLRSRYRNDAATRFSEIEGGLNKMTVGRFEQIIEKCGCPIEVYRLFPVKGLPFVTNVPIIREFWTSAVTCILRKPEIRCLRTPAPPKTCTP